MRRVSPRTHSFALTLCLLLLAGCGSSDGFARVRGEVTLNGEPLEGAVVEFQPVAEDGSCSSGETDANGRYDLMHTFDIRGAVPGEHVVRIRTAGTFFDDAGNEIERPERIPARYNMRSELTRIVEPASNTFNFEL